MTKYEDSVRRLLLKDSLETEKAKKILQSKAKIYGIAADDAKEVEERVVKKFRELEEFTINLIELNEDFNLTDSDEEEIYEFAKDIGLSEEDSEYVINKLLSQKHNEDIDNELSIIKDLKNEPIFETQTIGDLKIKYFANYDEYKNIVYINEVIDNAYIEFTQQICEIENRLDFTHNNILNIYSETIVTKIQSLFISLLDKNLICDEINADDFVRYLCRVDFIEEFCNSVKKLNSSANSSLDEITFANSQNMNQSLVVGSIGSVLAYNTISSVFKGTKAKMNSNKNRAIIDKNLYPIILDGANVLITKLYEDMIKRFRELKIMEILRCDIDIKKLDSNKKEVEAILSNLKLRSNSIQKEDEVNKLLYCIEKYPFKSEIYTRLIDLKYEDNIYLKYDLLKFALDILKDLDESKEIVKLECCVFLLIYRAKLLDIKQNVEIEEWGNEILKFKKRYNVTDDYIFSIEAIMVSIELESLNKIFTYINLNYLSDDDKQMLYMVYLRTNKDKGILELCKDVSEFRDIYQIEKDNIEADLTIIGTIINGDINHYSFENRKKVLARGYTTISERDCSIKMKADIAKELRGICGIDNEICFEIEKALFGNIISANDEEKKYMAIENNALSMYSQLGNKPFGRYFMSFIDDSFNYDRMIKFSNLDNTGDDKVLFCAMRNDLTKKEETVIFPISIIITLKNIYIYSQIESSKIEIKDIQQIIKRKISMGMENGEITYHTQLYIKVSGHDIPRLIDDKHIIRKEQFINFLYEYVKLSNDKVEFVNKVDTKPREEVFKFVQSIKNKNIEKVLISNHDRFKLDKKFENAYDSYIKLDGNEEMLVLFDAAIFGNGKRGFVVTNTSVHVKSMFDKGIKLYLDDIESIELKHSDIILNNDIKIDISKVLEDKEEFLVIFKKVIEILNQ